MSAAEWWILLGAFIGGAIPWLEAIIVIPAGILAGGPPVAVVALAAIGNLLTVWLTAVFGERLRVWWARRRADRRSRNREGESTETAERRQRRVARITRVMRRWGMPGLALLGPVGLGTQLSALAAVAAGINARVAFAWVGGGTLLWSVLAGVLTVAGVSIAGIGA